MKINLFLTSLLLSGAVVAQQPPTATGNQGYTSPDFWSRSGNGNFGASGDNNIFGTRWNSPIYTITGGLTPNTYRMVLNGEFSTNPLLQYPINGYANFGNAAGQVNTSGFLGLGNNVNGGPGSTPLWSGGNSGPFTLLHLNGRNGTFVLDDGYRSWMKYGITMTDNQDAMYIGPRAVELDVTEHTITWSDNTGAASPVGPDDFVFRYTENTNGNTNISGNRVNPSDFDGRHIARFTGQGDFGVGETFGLTQQGYVRPQSRVHASRQGGGQIWMQITNETGTGETEDDGLRFGIRNLPVSGVSGRIRWQENSPLVFQTDFDANPGFGNNNGERLRISSINAPGVPNPLGLNNNTTRVAISYRGNNPINAPRALLHLGENTSTISPNPNFQDGWRSWMDVGTFTNIDSDNMYIGLKDEGIDRKDAIINWGDNQVPGAFGPNGPDNLRFIFTSTTTATPPGQGDAVSQSADGLEVARMDPRLATTLPNADHYGMMGIGNFSINGPNTAPGDEINAKLDIDGDLRIRHVTAGDSTMLVMVIDTADHGRVHYLDLDSLVVAGQGGIGANNGCSIDPLNDTIVQWGHEHLVGTGANLLNDREIPMDNFDVHFLGTGANNDNLVSFGQPQANTLNSFEAKVFSYNDHEQNAFGGFTDASLVTSYGPQARIAGVDGAVIRGQNEFTAGVHGSARLCTGQGTGVYGEARNNQVNVGVRGEGNSAGSLINYGGSFAAFGGQTNYGVFASAGGGTTNWAGFFSGDVFANNFTTSDINLKQNIQDLNGAMAILAQLEPKTFEYQTSNYPQMNLETGNRMGLIAQDVQNVLPNLVKDAIYPAQYDSLGNQISSAVNFKVLKYEEIIPLLVAGAQEQNAVIEMQDSLIGDLQSQINQLYTMMMACCESNQAMQLNGTGGSDENGFPNSINVELNETQSIVLEQNVPNPFAEQTTINFSLPSSVEKAQMLFYNIEGKLIKSVDINERGASRINVFASDLSNGIYTYTLVADGEIVDTKRMVKQ